MLKIVHVADLHAGKTTARTLNRNEDLLKALEEVKKLLKTERVDYLIIAGDVFDKAIPDADSEHLIYDFLVEVGLTGTKTVLIGGNHDSPRKLRNITPWSEKFKIKVFPSFDFNDFIYADGEVAFVNLPFISERAITELSGTEADAKITYAERIRKLLLYAAERVKDYKYRILTAHLFFSGVRLGNTEREITVAETYAVDQSAIPQTFQYAALGHVHRYQRLEGAPTDAFYTGSLYQLDFGEAEQEKFFNFVVLEDNTAKVEKIKVPLLRKLKKITLSGEEGLKTLAELDKNTYLWVQVKTDNAKKFLEIKTKLERLLGERLLKITPLYPERRGGLLFKKESAAFGGSVHNPIEMYRLYLQSKGRSLDKKTERVLKELLSQLEF